MAESFDASAVNKTRRGWLNGVTGAFAAVGAAFAAVPFVRSFNPSERALAVGAPVEVKIDDLGPDELRVVKWRGKPVWIFRRDKRALQSLDVVEQEQKLADPESKYSTQPGYVDMQTRSRKKEVAVIVGVCTHLGCAPGYKPSPNDPSVGADWQGGFLCACHGSKFDLAGRVYKHMPAPTNLEVPPYRFKDDVTIVIGEDSEGVA